MSPTEWDANATKSSSQVRLLPKGLLDLDNISEDLQNIVKRNATESPLLRLPAELRMQIWDLITDNVVVRIRIYEERQNDIMIQVPCGIRLGEQQVTSIFRLPQVCRQLYAELSTLLYSRPTFAIPHWPRRYNRVGMVRDIELWTSRLPQAHREAIATVYPIGDIGYHYSKAREVTASLKRVFPGLENILVDKEALQYRTGMQSLMSEPYRLHEQRMEEFLAMLWSEGRIKAIPTPVTVVE